MATYVPRSHSPRVSGRASPQMLTQNVTPVTPVHSPHHSVTSSVSSRTPIHTLSIHEYRKQQNTPSSQTATPSGRILRRKAAAPTLNGIERAPSVTLATRSSSPSSFRLLHLSQSAQHLQTHQLPVPRQPRSDQLLRSQSAEPRTQGGSISSISTTTSTGKVRHFNSRKRLPKPPAAAGSITLPPHIVPVRTNQLCRPVFPTALEFSIEGSHSSDARTTPSASTFSLSQFPQPPHPIEPLFSPWHYESERSRINALSFTSAAPATPPATPATIHYRGASFDLVNPHDSLVLHDIVTPSRDFGSSEYLPVPTSEQPLLVSAEMAPKRALYGDFNAAHAGIMRRAEDSFSSSNIDLPLPPTPAAISPSSSTYTSPMYSPESNFAPSALAVKKATNDSRFSLKELTRTLTKRLGKAPEKQSGQELQELPDSNAHITSLSMEEGLARAPDETWVTTPPSIYFPVNPASPITPTSPMSPRERDYEQHINDEVELPQKHSLLRYGSEPLTSLIPDEYSTEMGRIDIPRMSFSEGRLSSRPYYDDLDSIYPSSSVYTDDDRRQSNYQQSLASAHQSNPLLGYSGMDASSFANEYNQDSLYGYSVRSVRSDRKSKPLSQEMYHRMASQEKTDTISKIIDQYDPNSTSIQSQGTIDHQILSRSESHASKQSLPIDRPHEASPRSGFDKFEFDLHHNAEQAGNNESINPKQPVLARRLTIARDLGSPPHALAPLAPPFQYDEAPFAFPQPQTSEIFSIRSSRSYGDTRNLLQIPQTNEPAHPVPGLTFQRSSSYSQPDAKPLEISSSYSQPTDSLSPRTPQAALDQAEHIFHGAITEQHHTAIGIPAMWARRSSGSMLLGKKASSQHIEASQTIETATVTHEVAGGGNEADWESDGGNSRGVRDSFGSIADYSSSEGTRNSLGLNSNGSLPSWQNHSQGPSIYSHPSPIRAHHHPFNSSPPQLRPRERLHTALESSSPSLASSPPGSTTVPAFRLAPQPEGALGRGVPEQPYALAPWANQYAFSDKETQELLASGPNDKIMFDYQRGSTDRLSYHTFQQQVGDVVPASSSLMSVYDSAGELERENTFEKLCVIGPKGNLTGTPRGTGMHETGSSVADTSSPGLTLNSSIARESLRSNGYPGFYAAPFPATGSVTRISLSEQPVGPEHARTTSQVTLFPKASELEPVIETPPRAGESRRPSLRCSTTFQRAQHRVSRTAVPGQTKLRQMILAPETARKTLSSADTSSSRFMGGSERPSTSDTNTPLRPQPSVDTPPTMQKLVAHQHSPHLLCPERAANAEDEERRRKLSWAILAVFCLLPPCIILYRVWGDSIIISLTKGQLGYCTNKSKKAALIAGIAVNIGIATAIVVPVVIAHALGAA